MSPSCDSLMFLNILTEKFVLVLGKALLHFEAGSVGGGELREGTGKLRGGDAEGAELLQERSEITGIDEEGKLAFSFFFCCFSFWH